MDRSMEFQDGADRARTGPVSVQQGSGGAYNPTSVLAQLIPGQNGLADPDQQRKIIGGSTVVGTSQATYDKRLWLPKTRVPSQRYDYTNG